MRRGVGGAEEGPRETLLLRLLWRLSFGGVVF